MALNKADLANNIKNALALKGFNVNPTLKDNKSWLSDFIDVLAEEIIDHITTNADVVVGDGGLDIDGALKPHAKIK